MEEKSFREVKIDLRHEEREKMKQKLSKRHDNTKMNFTRCFKPESTKQGRVTMLYPSIQCSKHHMRTTLFNAAGC